MPAFKKAAPLWYCAEEKVDELPEPEDTEESGQQGHFINTMPASNVEACKLPLNQAAKASV